MKTAMQELIEWGDKMLLKHPQKILGFGEVIDKAEELLEKEKEQIQNVFEHCWNHPNWEGDYDIKDMNDYIKQNK